MPSKFLTSAEQLKSALVIFALSQLASPAWATISDFSVSGAVSKVDLSNTTTPIVYGGMAGTCTPSSVFSTCDSCTGTAGATCNQARVSYDTKIRFQFKSTVTGTPKASTVNGNSMGSNGSTSSGVSTVDLTWGEICGGAITGSSTICANAGTGTVRIGIDASTDGLGNGTGDDYVNVSVKVAFEASTARANDCNTNDNPGMCNFQALPGDEKIYVAEPLTNSTFPNTGISNIQFKYIRFYYLAGTCATVGTTFTNATSTYSDAAIEVEDSSTSGKVTFDLEFLDKDIKNDVDYCITAALVDEAGNVNYFLQYQADAKPSEVFGLLSENKCFIATAAWGSPFENHVRDLREFRNKFLLTNSWGQAFVEFYYKHSPKWAKKISKDERARSLARVLLYPIWALAWVTLNIPSALVAIILFVLAAIIPAFAIMKRRGS